MNMTDVLVVGAGPVGLTLANILQTCGVQTRILTKEPELRPVAESRAEGVHPRTMHLLEQFGLLDQAFQQGRPLHGVSMRSKDRLLGRFSLDDPATQFFPGALIIEQGKVERLLAARLESRGIIVERGLEFLSMQSSSGEVISNIRSADGAEQQIASRYLVGCDGAHSTVRAAIGTSFEGEANPGSYALADANLDWLGEPLNDDLHVFFSPLVVMGRLAEGSWKIAGLMPEDLTGPATEGSASTERDRVLATLQQQLDRNTVGASIRSARWTSRFRISTRQVESMRRGPVFLAGDAAHIHSPMGGQGMNEGMQDALNLAWKLSFVIRHGAPEQTLHTYRQERTPVISNVLQETAQMTRMIELDSHLAIGVRDAAISLAAALRPAQDALRLQFAGTSRPSGDSPLFDTGSLSLPDRLRAATRTAHPNPLDDVSFASGPAAMHRALDAEHIGTAGTTAERRLFTIWASEPDPFQYRLLLFASRHNESDLEVWQQENAQVLPALPGWCCVYYIVQNSTNALTPDLQRITVLHDAAGELHERYGARSACYYLIRPDAFVALRRQGRNLLPVSGYFERLHRASGEQPETD